MCHHRCVSLKALLAIAATNIGYILIVKRGCIIERTQSKPLFNILMMNATIANGFKMIYFDRTNIEGIHPF